MIVSSDPFFHIVIDNFFDSSVAEQLSSEFIDYDNEHWFFYKNQIENKKTINDWKLFPKQIYSTFNNFCSPSFTETLQNITGIPKLHPDYGLHGGGLHMHGRNGKLNVHQDYSLHPKLVMQRKLNLIVYLSKDWRPEWGGGLELWSHDDTTNQPKEKVKEVDCVFNRAVLFDTTQNSWHGLPNEITCPEGVYRKSLAMYYLVEPDSNVDPRKRALFAPSENQLDDMDVKSLIEQRSKLSF